MITHLTVTDFADVRSKGGCVLSSFPLILSPPSLISYGYTTYQKACPTRDLKKHKFDNLPNLGVSQESSIKEAPGLPYDPHRSVGSLEAPPLRHC